VVVGGGVVRPEVWQPPVACSRLEREVIKRVKRAKLLVWLREHRHELFDEAFQAELAATYLHSLPAQSEGAATGSASAVGACDDP